MAALMLLPVALCNLSGGGQVGNAVPDISVILEGKHWLTSEPARSKRLAWEFFILNTCDDRCLIAAISKYVGRSQPPANVDIGGLYLRELDVGVLTRLRFGAASVGRPTYGGGALLLSGAWAQAGAYRVLRPERHGGFASDHYYGLEEYMSRISQHISESKSILRLWR